jgi:hypothetical protein
VILSHIDRDATKAEELDDVMRNAGISYYLSASEIIRQFLKEWKYLSELSSVEDFVHPILPGLHLCAVRPERSEAIMAKIFTLKDRSRAILSDNDHRSIIPIPARAMVTLVGGDIYEDAFVKIRYEGRVLLMLSEDLRSGGEQWGISA